MRSSNNNIVGTFVTYRDERVTRLAVDDPAGPCEAAQLRHEWCEQLLQQRRVLALAFLLLFLLLLLTVLIVLALALELLLLRLLVLLRRRRRVDQA